MSIQAEQLDLKQEIQAIEEKGFTRIPNVFSLDKIQELLALLLEEKKRAEASLAKNVPYLNRAQPMVYNLQNKRIEFLASILRCELLEDILKYFLNDQWFKQIPQEEPNYIMRSFLGRSSAGALPLHIDSFIPYQGDFPLAMQAVIVLEDMSEQNGCTIVVPGSHKSGTYVEQSARDSAMSIQAKAGDLIVWDSRLWHGTTANQTDSSRWALIATFTRWWVKQAFNITENLPQEIYQHLSPKEQAILGFCSIPYNNESEGIDMKSGWENLPERLEKRLMN